MAFENSETTAASAMHAYACPTVRSHIETNPTPRQVSGGHCTIPPPSTVVVCHPDRYPHSKTQSNDKQ